MPFLPSEHDCKWDSEGEDRGQEKGPENPDWDAKKLRFAVDVASSPICRKRKSGLLVGR